MCVAALVAILGARAASGSQQTCMKRDNRSELPNSCRVPAISANSGCPTWVSLFRPAAGKIARPTIDCSFARRLPVFVLREPALKFRATHI